MSSKPSVDANTNRSTRRQKSSGNSKRKPTSSTRYATVQQVFGGKFSPSANPPDVDFQPWHRVTLVDPFSGTMTVSVDSLRDKLRKQLDPTGRGFNPKDEGDKRFVPQFKIHAIQAWNLTGHIISISVQDYTDSKSASSGQDQLAGIVDTGSPGLLPKVGFRFPASHRNHVLRCDDDEHAIQIASMQVGPSDQGLAYITLEYRFDGATTLPTTHNLFSVLTKCYANLRTINTSANHTTVNTRLTADTAESILHKMKTFSVVAPPVSNQPDSSENQRIIDLLLGIEKRLSILESPTTSEFDVVLCEPFPTDQGHQPSPQD